MKIRKDITENMETGLEQRGNTTGLLHQHWKEIKTKQNKKTTNTTEKER